MSKPLLSGFLIASYTNVQNRKTTSTIKLEAKILQALNELTTQNIHTASFFELLDTLKVIHQFQIEQNINAHVIKALKENLEQYITEGYFLILTDIDSEEKTINSIQNTILALQHFQTPLSIPAAELANLLILMDENNIQASPEFMHWVNIMLQNATDTISPAQEASLLEAITRIFHPTITWDEYKEPYEDTLTLVMHYLLYITGGPIEQETLEEKTSPTTPVDKLPQQQPIKKEVITSLPEIAPPPVLTQPPETPQSPVTPGRKKRKKTKEDSPSKRQKLRGNFQQKPSLPAPPKDLTKEDLRAWKRLQGNKRAAKISRDKNKEAMLALEKSVKKLEEENEKLKATFFKLTGKNFPTSSAFKKLLPERQLRESSLNLKVKKPTRNMLNGRPTPQEIGNRRREQNKIFAQLSRYRKKEYINKLGNNYEELQDENDCLREKIQDLQGEISPKTDSSDAEQSVPSSLGQEKDSSSSSKESNTEQTMTDSSDNPPKPSSSSAIKTSTKERPDSTSDDSDLLLPFITDETKEEHFLEKPLREAEERAMNGDDEEYLPVPPNEESAQSKHDSFMDDIKKEIEKADSLSAPVTALKESAETLEDTEFSEEIKETTTPHIITYNLLLNSSELSEERQFVDTIKKGIPEIYKGDYHPEGTIPDSDEITLSDTTIPFPLIEKPFDFQNANHTFLGDEYPEGFLPDQNIPDPNEVPLLLEPNHLTPQSNEFLKTSILETDFGMTLLIGAFVLTNLYSSTIKSTVANNVAFNSPMLV